jgi:hypothetical protein
MCIQLRSVPCKAPCRIESLWLYSDDLESQLLRLGCEGRRGSHRYRMPDRPTSIAPVRKPRVTWPPLPLEREGLGEGDQAIMALTFGDLECMREAARIDNQVHLGCRTTPRTTNRLPHSTALSASSVLVGAIDGAVQTMPFVINIILKGNQQCCPKPLLRPTIEPVEYGLPRAKLFR